MLVHLNKQGKELIETDVFIIDEISMVPKHALEIADRVLQELMGNKLPFGGKIVIIGGDFRQCLPIRKHGSKEQQLSLSVRRSYLWKYFKNEVFHLLENKRAEKSSTSKSKIDFAKYILDMGNGDLSADEDDYVEVPEECVVKTDLVEEIFGPYIKTKYFSEMCKRVILASTHNKVLDVNNKVLNQLGLNGCLMKIYYSVDKVDEDEPDNCVDYPQEFLHTLHESGLPPYELRLTEGCPVILVRNLNPAAGLSNGTRMQVEKMYQHVLQCKLLTGENAGQTVLIPKIKLTSSDLPFTLFRKQFPVKPCFAMTINKSQGQTIDFVGIDLSDSVFSHGQAYVAFSRARGWDCIKVATDPKRGNKIRNVVWKEILLDEPQNPPQKRKSTPPSKPVPSKRLRSKG